MANVTSLMGSPRINGNTARLVNAFTGGISLKHNVEVINSAKLNIGPCVGCNSCFKNEGHKCFQSDDMEMVYELLSKTDV